MSGKNFKKLEKRLFFLALVVISLMFLFHGKSYGISYPNAIVCKIISVYDGDTFRANLCNLPPIIGNNISIRIYGIDTPEIKDKRPIIKNLAYTARDIVREKLSKARLIELKNIRRGKYFRIVAIVYIDGENLGNYLIKEGLAKEYFGKTKLKW